MVKRAGLRGLGWTYTIAAVALPCVFLTVWEWFDYGTSSGVEGWILWNGVPMAVIGVLALQVSRTRTSDSRFWAKAVGIWFAAVVVGICTVLIIWRVWLPLPLRGRVTVAAALNLEGLPIMVMLLAGIAYVIGYLGQR